MSVEAKTESEQLVLRFFATLSAGDLEGVRRMLHDEATWKPQMRSVPGAGLHRGPKGIVDDFLVPVRALFRPGDPTDHCRYDRLAGAARHDRIP